MKTISRLRYLSKMIAKYAHRWGECPSARLTGWVDEYNDIKEEQPEIFAAYCKEVGAAPEHDAYDCLA